MRRLAFQVLCGSLVWMPIASVSAQSAPDAKPSAAQRPQAESPTHAEAIAILKKADAAIKLVKSVRYHGRVSAEGPGAAHFPVIEGKAALAGEWCKGLTEFYFDVTVQAIDGVPSRRLTTGGNGETFFLIDWAKKIAHEGTDLNVVGADGRRAQAIKMIEFIYPTPFTHEIEGERVEVLDSEVVSKQECHVVHVVYGINGQQATWYFSKNDLLPRRVRRSFPTYSGARAVRVYTITDLQVNPVFPKQLFRLDLPEGFKKTGEFAPERRRMPW